jgi:hypothetical protein
MDVYPDVAVAAGVFRPTSLAARLLGAAMGAGLRRASAVVVLGRSVRRPVLSRGVPRRRIRVVENWAPAEVEAAASTPPFDRRRAEDGSPPRPDRPWTLMYSGNYGVAHDLGPLLERLRALPRQGSWRLVVQASGSRVAELRRALQGFPVPVEWREPVRTEDLASSLRQADAHVVCVRAGFERLVVPSKVYAPLALGIPVLAVGAPPRRAPRAEAGKTPDALDAIADGSTVTRLAATPRPRADALATWRSVLEALARGQRR